MNTIEKATSRPWKAPVLWDISGIVRNAIHQDCQPGCVFKSDTTEICWFPENMEINRPNAELIVKAVNEHDALNAVAEAAAEGADWLIDAHEGTDQYERGFKIIKALKTLSTLRAKEGK